MSLADENFNLFLTPWEPGGAGSRVSTHYNLPQLETKLRKVFTITVKAEGGLYKGPILVESSYWHFHIQESIKAKQALGMLP